MKSEKRFDNVIYGLIPGIVLPVLTLIVFWFVRFDGGYFEFLDQFQRYGMLSKVLSLCTIPNLLLFFLFIWSNRSFSARGVIFATLVIAFVMLVLKFA
ncbi:MAG: hypothetical protein ABFS38_11770 [Bacteroidota bacterium]